MRLQWNLSYAHEVYVTLDELDVQNNHAPTNLQTRFHARQGGHMHDHSVQLELFYHNGARKPWDLMGGRIG